MPYDVSEAIEKLREIEDQARIALAELPHASIAYSRLRHIGILARFARMKLQGASVDPLEPMAEHSGQPLAKRPE